LDAQHTIKRLKNKAGMKENNEISTLPFLTDENPYHYRSFKNGLWNNEIDVRDFIQKNIHLTRKMHHS